MLFDLDPRFTFDSFVVGETNRVAVDAARRAAVPGSGHNPLVLYGGSGLGKTHLLNAIGHRAQRLHSMEVVYLTVEHLSDRVASARSGEDVFRGRLDEAGLLLLDDVQLTVGQPAVQNAVLQAWDALPRGAQVVITTDRPPDDIPGLDRRLHERINAGLIVDLAPPDRETRVSILTRRAEERGQALSPGVYEALADLPFTNVRELLGALNRVIAVQELEERKVEAAEVTDVIGAVPGDGGADGTAGDAGATAAGQRLAGAVREWKERGFRTDRLERLRSATDPIRVAETVAAFERDVGRLQEIERSLNALEAETADGAAELLKDPDRLAEAEEVLARVQDRQPPPGPPDAPGLAELDEDSLALRAASAVVAAPGASYNPLYLAGPPGGGKSTLLAALGNTLRDQREMVVAYTDGAAFAKEAVAASEHGRLESWRARYRRAEALLLDDMERLAGSAEAAEELFHLFEEMHRTGRQLVFVGSVAPQDLAVPERLRSRLEGGLVVRMESRRPPTPHRRSPGGRRGASEPEDRDWIMSREKVAWEWPYAVDWAEESLD